MLQTSGRQQYDKRVEHQKMQMKPQRPSNHPNTQTHTCKDLQCSTLCSALAAPCFASLLSILNLPITACSTVIIIITASPIVLIITVTAPGTPFYLPA